MEKQISLNIAQLYIATSYNYGNTIEGSGQNLGTFGDSSNKFKHGLHSVPILSKIIP